MTEALARELQFFCFALAAVYLIYPVLAIGQMISEAKERRRIRRILDND